LLVLNAVQQSDSKTRLTVSLSQEDEILDLIEQCEAEEGTRPLQPKMLSSMPVLTPPSSRGPSRKSRGYLESSSDDSDSDDFSAVSFLLWFNPTYMTLLFHYSTALNSLFQDFLFFKYRLMLQAQ